MSNNVKISGKPSGQIAVKRLYLPGMKLTAMCPCGMKLVRDFEQQYLSYPDMNEPYNVLLYCEDCNETVSLQVMLKVSLKLVAPTG